MQDKKLLGDELSLKSTINASTDATLKAENYLFGCVWQKYYP